jgi:hypothetical protein
VLAGSCLLKHALDTAYREFIAVLDRYSLVDVTGGPTGQLLQQLMLLPIIPATSAQVAADTEAATELI